MTQNEAVDLLQSDDLVGIGMAADSLRRKLHPEGVVTYIIDRNINYTNFCTWDPLESTCRHASLSIL